MRFDSTHPAVSCGYFAFAILCTVLFRHPVYLAVNLLCSFALLLCLMGRRSLRFAAAAPLLIAAGALWYGTFTRSGVTPLAGGRFMLESLLYGAALGAGAAALLMWLRGLFFAVTAEKLLYLLGRAFPKASLYIVVLLREYPRAACAARGISDGRAGIGKPPALRERLARVSALISRAAGDFFAVSQSMRTRGFSLKGRTAAAHYRFDNRDRFYAVALFACAALQLTAFLLNQTTIYWFPRIIADTVTPLSLLFYGSYALFCLLPVLLQLRDEYRFAHVRVPRGSL